MPTSIFQQLQTSSASVDTKTPVLVAAGAIPDEMTAGVPVQAVPQRQDRLGFSKVVAANGVDTALMTIVARSAGVGVSQSAGNLLITTGTTANQELILRGVGTYVGGIRLNCASFLSQRIANQNFYVELVDVLGDALSATVSSATAMTVTLASIPTLMGVGQGFMVGGYSGTGTLPSQRAVIASISGNVVTLTIAGASAGTGTVSVFGWNYYQVAYNGVSATSALYNNQRYGWKDTDTTLTINTTASPGHMLVISGNDARARVSDHLLTSQTAVTITDRASRAINVPDDVVLYLQLRSVNGTAAPASTTTWSVNALQIGNFAGQDVVIQDQRMSPALHKVDVNVASSALLTTVINGSTSASAMGDAITNPTTQPVGSFEEMFNGATWDRVRNNANLTVDTSAAKTTSVAGATQINFNSRGAIITVLFGAVTGTTPTLAVQLQWSPDGATWINYGSTTFAAATPTSGNTWVCAVYPAQLADDTTTTLAGFTTGATVFKAFNAPLPRTWRLNYTVAGTTPSITFAAYVNYLN